MFDWLRQSLINGEIAEQEEISLKSLSRKLRVPLRSLRNEAQGLADHGLLTIRRENSISVRLPSAQDMAESYLARRALGAIAVRATLGWPRQDRKAAEELNAELREYVRLGDMERAHFLDLEFQLLLFASSPLERIPAMLEVLTHQAFMHFAVIGGRYAFSPGRILEHNCKIAEALNSSDAQAATVAWHAKMDEGLSYMNVQITNFQRRRATAH